MTQAWLLDLGDGFAAAVGIGELVHLLHSPTAFAVPHTPPHAAHVLEWNGKLVPLLDLPHWLRGAPAPETRLIAAVIACQPGPLAPVDYVAMYLAKPPIRIPVSDTQACPLPEPAGPWQVIALAAFEHGGVSVPVLDTEQLTSQVLPVLGASHSG